MSDSQRPDQESMNCVRESMHKDLDLLIDIIFKDADAPLSGAAYWIERVAKDETKGILCVCHGGVADQLKSLLKELSGGDIQQAEVTDL